MSWLKSLSRRTPVCAANGHELPIRTVFAHVLRHFKEMALRECTSRSDNIDESEFEWVITVPAIWKGGAKQMMREAAYEVIKDNALLILNSLLNSRQDLLLKLCRTNLRLLWSLNQRRCTVNLYK